MTLVIINRGHANAYRKKVKRLTLSFVSTYVVLSYCSSSRLLLPARFPFENDRLEARLGTSAKREYDHSKQLRTKRSRKMNLGTPDAMVVAERGRGVEYGRF